MNWKDPNTAPIRQGQEALLSLDVHGCGPGMDEAWRLAWWDGHATAGTEPAWQLIDAESWAGGSRMRPGSPWLRAWTPLEYPKKIGLDYNDLHEMVKDAMPQVDPAIASHEFIRPIPLVLREHGVYIDGVRLEPGMVILLFTDQPVRQGCRWHIQEARVHATPAGLAIETQDLFGVHWPVTLEALVYTVAGALVVDQSQVGP